MHHADVQVTCGDLADLSHRVQISALCVCGPTDVTEVTQAALRNEAARERDALPGCTTLAEI